MISNMGVIDAKKITFIRESQRDGYALSRVDIETARGNFTIQFVGDDPVELVVEEEPE